MGKIYKSKIMERKISVIVPVYNAEKYLNECLKSIINQTLQEIEIICVNDGSTDNSLSILQHYADIDKRMRIINQDNHGAGVARNKGMAVAQGKYLAFLDADDLYLSDTLETCYKYAEEKNIDVLMFEAEYFDCNNVLIKTEQVNITPLGNLQVFSSKDIPQFIFQISSCNTWNKLYRKDFVIKFELQYQNIRTANDLYFVYSAVTCAERIAVLNIPLVKHRILYKDNLQSLKKETPMDFFIALVKLKEKLQQFKKWEILKQSYLNCALYHCAYNYQTVGINGKKQFENKGDEICELLELCLHSSFYYYNQNDYMLIHEIILDKVRRKNIMLQKIRSFLKRILPPPVNSFNREMGFLRQYILELNMHVINAQKQRYKELEVLFNRTLEEMVNVEKQLPIIDKKLSMLLESEIKILEAEHKTKKEIIEILKSEICALEKAIKKDGEQVKRDYEFYEGLSPDKYAGELAIYYQAKTGKKLYLAAPWTFSEKIQWLKLYDSTPLKTRLADKYLVRDWIKEKIGEEYLIPLLGVWDSFDEIDFDMLPNRFVLKANHGSGWNILVDDKSTFDKANAKKKFDYWMGLNYAFRSLELHYMNIPPKIIAEQYLEGVGHYGYKFMCFNGEVKFLWITIGRFHDLRVLLMSIDWQPMDAIIGYSPPNVDIPKPKNFNKMLEIATTLSQGFAHVRVDLYEVAGQIYFGEMTFTSNSGTARIMPEEFDEQMGKWLKLPSKSPIPQKQ